MRGVSLVCVMCICMSGVYGMYVYLSMVCIVCIPHYMCCVYAQCIYVCNVYGIFLRYVACICVYVCIYVCMYVCWLCICNVHICCVYIYV